MSVMNCCVVYNMIHGKNGISDKGFRREIYLKLDYGIRSKMESQTFERTISFRESVADEVKFDNKGYISGKCSQQRIVCQYHKVTSCNIRSCG